MFFLINTHGEILIVSDNSIIVNKLIYRVLVHIHIHVHVHVHMYIHIHVRVHIHVGSKYYYIIIIVILFIVDRWCVTVSEGKREGSEGLGR